MAFSLTAKRTLLSGGRYSIEALTRSRINSEHFNQLIDFSLNEILGREILFGHEVLDRKGKHPTISNSDLAPENSISLHEEFLYLSGTCVVESEDPAEDRSERAPFALSISAEFVRFQGLRQIVYQPRERREGALRVETPLARIMHEPNVTCEYLRVGVDYFRPRLFWLLGLSPLMYQSIYLEFNRQELSLRLIGSAMQNARTLPVSDQPFFAKFSELIRRATRIDLLEQITEAKL